MGSPNGPNIFNFNVQDDSRKEHGSNIIQVTSADGNNEKTQLCRTGSLRRGPLRPSSPRPDRPRSPAGGRRASAQPQRISPYGKVEIFVRCEDLPKMDTFSSSDPICVLYVRKYGQWVEYGRTECIPNCPKPKFTETLILDTNNQDHHHLKFSIFDTENLTSKDLHKHQLIGSLEIELFNLLEKENNNNNHDTVYDLKFQDQAKKRGKIHVVAEQVEQHAVNTQVKLCLSALKLSKKGLNIFGKCDAYFELERKVKNDNYHPVYRSEVIFRNSEPRWKPFQISLQKLCNGDRDANVRITIYNYHTKGDYAFIGSAETSFQNMTRRIGDVKTLHLKKHGFMRSFSVDSKRGRQDSLGKAVVRILQCVPVEQFSLVDYVKGSCSINFVAAVDFSSSNVEEEEEEHFPTFSVESEDQFQNFKEEKVDTCEAALHEVGSWLCYYDPRNRYELYGFGGILNGDKASSSCFSLERVKSNKMFQGGPSAIEELVQLYRSNLPYIEPSGPTLFTPLVERITANLKTTVSQDEQHFTLALIVTDGICNDMKDLADALVKYRDHPISFVVSCLGPLRTETMHYFAILNQDLIRRCGRSIIYPISFCDEKMNQSLQVIRSTFAKLSSDIVNYFVSRSIRPKTPDPKSPTTPLDTFQKTLAAQLEDPLTSVENDNWQNFLKEATSFCPTCGSHSSTKSNIPDVNIR